MKHFGIILLWFILSGFCMGESYNYDNIEDCLLEHNKCYQGGCSSTAMYCGDCWYEKDGSYHCPKECNTLSCNYYACRAVTESSENPYPSEHTVSILQD